MMKDPLSSVSFLLFIFKVFVVCVVFWNQFQVKGFATSATTITGGRNVPQLSQNSRIILAAAGRGMGMGGAGAVKKKGGKKSKKPSSSVTKAATPFNVNSSLLRMEKKYDELLLNAAKELQKEEDEHFRNSSSHTPMMTSEYVIAARSVSKRSVPDWVPIAQLCLARPESEYEEGASDAMVQSAISAFCRELSHVAANGAPVFATIARNELQYSVESVESFHKHVYDEVVDGNANKNQDETMRKVEARQILGLDSTTTEKTEIKQAYRKLSFELHPDRFKGTPEECEEAKIRFSKVKLAYETLSSGVRGEEGISWYESLGGRARTGFVGPIDLLPLAAAQEHMRSRNAAGAIVGLEPPLVQSFVARHLRSE
jgi:hypothetical protein